MAMEPRFSILAMGKYVSLTLSADARRKAEKSRRITEVTTYLREAERIIDQEVERSIVDLMAFGVAEWPSSKSA
jgi:hypothetical protein